MSLLKKLFPVQSRESELEQSAQTCLNHIMNNSKEFTITEQVRIVNYLKERIGDIIVDKCESLQMASQEYDDALKELQQ